MSLNTPDPRDDVAHIIPVSGALRRSRRKWRVLAFVALAIAVLALVGRFAVPNQPLGDEIARVEINGTIATDALRLKTLTDIAENDTIKALVVTINSPGGTTAGGEELYEALAVVRAKKPVVAVINELGASAAYMTAIGADRIFARRLSIVGSIGVLYQHVNAGKLLDTIGIELDKVASGPLKAEPDLNEPLQGAVRESLMGLITDSFNWFVDVVAERRELDRSKVLVLADGRIMTGQQGVSEKLIDAIGGEAEAIAWLEADKGIAEDLPVYTHYPLPEAGWGSWAKYLGGQARSALGLPDGGPIVLDGLVSLWQVGAAL